MEYLELERRIMDNQAGNSKWWTGIVRAMLMTLHAIFAFEPLAKKFLPRIPRKEKP